MTIPNHVILAIQNLLNELVDGNYLLLEKDGRAGRLTANEIEKALEDYGQIITNVPEQSLKSLEGILVDGPDELWSVDVDLWTIEQGQSDLTLSLWVRVNEGRVTIQIIDLHVM